jgi:hypothetical protein
VIVARPATPGKWCDTSWKPTKAQLQALRDAGYVGIIRYLPLPLNDASHDIDASELKEILTIGLELLLVQHVRRPPWSPGLHPGSVDGASAAEWAKGVGYPDAHIYLDLEGLLGDAAAQVTVDYCNAWASRVLQSGFRAGLYVGYDTFLTPEQLYWDLIVDTYWSDAARRHVAERGCAMAQGAEHTVDGLTIDEDALAPDLHGGVPFACCAD